jgi:hypothetical protein
MFSLVTIKTSCYDILDIIKKRPSRQMIVMVFYHTKRGVTETYAIMLFLCKGKSHMQVFEHI